MVNDSEFKIDLQLQQQLLQSQSQFDMISQQMRDLDFKSELISNGMKMKASRDSVDELQKFQKNLVTKKQHEQLHEIVDLKSDSDVVVNLVWKVERLTDELQLIDKRSSKMEAVIGEADEMIKSNKQSLKNIKNLFLQSQIQFKDETDKNFEDIKKVLITM